ncbi:MAG: hypothetical protein AB7P14_23890 [Blastocatellales bacterium]
MITTILNQSGQTRRIGNSISTHAYDTGELDTMLCDADRGRNHDAPGTQLLSPELLGRIMAGGFVQSQSEPLPDDDGQEVSLI